MEFRTGRVSANSIDFHYLELGAGPLVICLHGFPDNAYTYRYLLPTLADAGFRAVAPFMRGYFPSGNPPSPVALGSTVVLIAGRPAARIGDIAGCGAHIIVGAFTVEVGG